MSCNLGWWSGKAAWWGGAQGMGRGTLPSDIQKAREQWGPRRLCLRLVRWVFSWRRDGERGSRAQIKPGRDLGQRALVVGSH